MGRFFTAAILFVLAISPISPANGNVQQDDGKKGKSAAGGKKTLKELLNNSDFRSGFKQGFLASQRNHLMTNQTLKRFAKAKLTEKQKLDIDLIAFEFADAIIARELKTELTAQLMAKEKKIREQTRKQATKEGKKGKEIDAAISRASLLTKKQQQAYTEIEQLMTGFDKRALGVLTAEQKKLLGLSTTGKTTDK